MQSNRLQVKTTVQVDSSNDVLQSGRDATGSLRRSGCRSRSCGSHPCSIMRLLAVVRRLTIRAWRGRELGRSPREGQRTRCGKGLGLSRVGGMRLNTLHGEGYVAAQRRICGQPSRSSRGRKTSQCLPYKLMLARSSLRCSGRGVADNKAESDSDRGGSLESSGRNNLGGNDVAHENGRNLLHFKNQRVFIRDYAARRIRGWQRRRQRGGSGIFFFFFVIVFVVVGVSTVVPCARWESIKRRCVPKERVPVLLLLSAAGDGVNKCAFLLTRLGSPVPTSVDLLPET